MNVLAIETATAVCGAAVVQNGIVRAEKFIEARQVHSQKIMGLIDEVLRSTQSTLQEIDGIAVSIGPGSFTGLRIGLSTAKGLAFALDKPVTAVSTLTALASNVARQANITHDVLVLPVIDARRDEVFSASYRVQTAGLTETMTPRAVALGDLFELLDGEVLVAPTGDATDKFFQYLTATHADQLHRFIRLPADQCICSAAAVGILGAEQLEHGQYADLASLEPLYVKEFYTKMTQPQHIEQR